jgi:23S rRNA (uracil1939-C5)-methyltransferase
MPLAQRDRGVLQEQPALIEALDQDGRGIARIDGKVAFIEGALPGELVRWAQTRAKTRFDSGKVVQVLRASSLRTIPHCPHFGLAPGSCGGCSMQHLDSRAQVAVKQRVLEDALWHIGHLRPELVLRPIVGEAWHYRHRARLSVRFVARKGGVLVGFHERASSYVADMHVCPVLARPVSDLIDPLRELVGRLSVRQRLPQIEVAVGTRRCVLVFRVLEAPTDPDRAALAEFAAAHGVEIWLQPRGPESATPLDPGQGAELSLPLEEFGLALAFRPTDFTQVNHRINEVLVRRALGLLDVQREDAVADFFCGMGNFTLPIATRARRVLGLEGSEPLISRARDAARQLELAERTHFVARNLFEWSPADWSALCKSAGGRIDRVLLDPPRDGALAVVQSMADRDLAPRRLVYVSCNPATLARDCAWLVHEAGWVLRAAGVVNMFPHTSHVESIAMLEPGQT